MNFEELFLSRCPKLQQTLSLSTHQILLTTRVAKQKLKTRSALHLCCCLTQPQQASCSTVRNEFLGLQLSIGRSIGRTLDRLLDRSFDSLVDRSIVRSLDRSTVRVIARWLDRSLDHAIARSTERSFGRFLLDRSDRFSPSQGLSKFNNFVLILNFQRDELI